MKKAEMGKKTDAEPLPIYNSTIRYGVYKRD